MSHLHVAAERTVEDKTAGHRVLLIKTLNFTMPFHTILTACWLHNRLTACGSHPQNNGKREPDKLPILKHFLVLSELRDELDADICCAPCLVLCGL
jgi:hypothetical protein